MDKCAPSAHPSVTSNDSAPQRRVPYTLNLTRQLETIWEWRGSREMLRLGEHLEKGHSQVSNIIEYRGRDLEKKRDKSEQKVFSLDESSSKTSRSPPACCQRADESLTIVSVPKRWRT